MLDKVKKTISDNDMISAEDRILVALSGGCDSVCLCLALKTLGFEFSVAHLNHSIREEALSDQQFCENFAKKIGVDIYVKKVDVPALAKKYGIGLELAGRNARYEFFDELCNKKGFTKIAVAHNLDDNAETVLLNLVRGTGIKGLCGIPKVRDKVIRPLIDVARQEIEEFVNEYSQSFVVDKTNFSEEYSRNKIRGSIIPKLLQINPKALENISKASEILTHDDFYLDCEAEKFVILNNGCACIKKEEFKQLDYSIKARTLLKLYTYAAGTSKDFEKKHIDYIIENFDKTNGAIIQLCFGVVCRSEYDKIIFEKSSEETSYSYILPLNGEVYIEEAGVKFTSAIVPKDEAKYIDNAQFFDLSCIDKEIVIRSRKQGDKIIPFGKNNEVKVKDILIKDKIPLNKRKNLPIIECGEILWIFGVRRSDLYKITDKTDKVLALKGEVLC
ncbi:MAG: tRNA lysidine(34) synthetase TilS [Clostridia bacterium]|nr:tRNA lysidine(34) synthetase TilS [Clostridia bacterium]